MNATELPLIISLTSYPPRIRTVDFVIRSLLAQTVKPWKIVLWLARDEFPDGEASLPTELIALTRGTNFEIDWCENIRSYKKLIPSLRKYPDCCIVTVDDDLIYPQDMLERLVHAHRCAPMDIHALRVRVITAKSGAIQPFLDWLPNWIGGQGPVPASFDTHLIGFGGVLYPPNCLDSRVFDMTMANQLCPHQDDFWFWTMAVLKGTRIHGASCTGYSPHPVPGTEENGLWQRNVSNGGNDSCLRKLLASFPELRTRLLLDHPPLPKNIRVLGGLIKGSRESNRLFSLRLNIPLFQVLYNSDFSEIYYRLFKIPVWKQKVPEAMDGQLSGSGVQSTVIWGGVYENNPAGGHFRTVSVSIFCRSSNHDDAAVIRSGVAA